MDAFSVTLGWRKKAFVTIIDSAEVFKISDKIIREVFFFVVVLMPLKGKLITKLS